MSESTIDTERRWFLSQAKENWRSGDDKLPRVLASATAEALRIVAEILRVGSSVGPNGEIIISWWSVHRMAIRLQEIADTGSLEPCPAHEHHRYAGGASNERPGGTDVG